MKVDEKRIDARVLIAGKAQGTVMILDDTLSFWGGFNPANGEIIDVHHPQYQQRVAGKILCIPQSRGSAGTPGGIAETLRNGSGPLAFVLAQADVNIGVGTLVANRLYDLEIPVLEVSLSTLRELRCDDQLRIDEQGMTLISGRDL